MNRRFLILTVASMLMMPMISSASSMVQVQQTKVAENAKGTEFFKGSFKEALAKEKKENKKLAEEEPAPIANPESFDTKDVDEYEAENSKGRKISKRLGK